MILLKRSLQLDKKNNIPSLSNLETIIFDFDGIFTNNKVNINEDGIDRLWWKQKDSIGIAGELGFYDVNYTELIKFCHDFGQDIRMDFIIGPIP